MVSHHRTTLSYRRRPASRAATGSGLRRDDRMSGIILMTARLAVLGLLLTTLAAGCADNGAASGNDRRPVFYGGVSGGGTWP